MRNVKTYNERNELIDIEKGISCVLVILIHCHLKGLMGGLLTAFSRSAVALFFMISGFYTFGIKDKSIATVIIRRVKKIFTLLLCSLIFYFFWESFLRIYGSGFQSAIGWWTTSALSFDTWFNVIMWDNDPFAGHLWFLFALIRSYGLYLLIKLYCPKLLKTFTIVLGILLFVLRLLVSTQYYRNGWIYGLFFFLLGYGIAENKEIYKDRLNFPSLIFIFSLGILFIVFEYYVDGVQQIYFGNILVSISALFISISKIPIKSIFNKSLIFIGSQLSMYIYVIHWAIIDVFSKFGKILDINETDWYCYIIFICVSIISMPTALLIKKVVSEMNRLLRRRN